MQVHRGKRPAQVIGPFGEALSLADLPKDNMTRWVIRRKAEVVAAVNGGLLSLEEACNRYDLSLEEFCSWQETIDKAGLLGLRISHHSKNRTGNRGSRGKPGRTAAHRADVSRSGGL